MVRMDAFQASDPGSIPGQCIFVAFSCLIAAEESWKRPALLREIVPISRGHLGNMDFAWPNKEES